MSDKYNGHGGSFTIDPETGDVALTIPVADEKKIAYNPPNDENLTGESEHGTAN